MKKLLVLAALLFVTTTFANMIPIPNGDYAFITNEGEKIIFMVSDNKLVMKNSKNQLLDFKMKIFEGNTIYCNNKGVSIYFQDLSSCTMITKNSTYILKNLYPNK